ncbi:MAG: phosphatase PAP2 family protein [Pseudomonadota bacterium]
MANPDPDIRFNPLPFDDPHNIRNWAEWVRASLYLSTFMRRFYWQSASSPDRVDLWFQVRAPSGAPGAPTSGDNPYNQFAVIARPSADAFRAQVRFLHQYADQRPERSAEIMSQVGFPSAYFLTLMGMIVGRNRHLIELMTITQVISAHVAMVVKHALACRRPDEIDATVMPMIPTPGHSAFPSAHATEAFSVARLLHGVIDQHPDHFSDADSARRLVRKQAERIAVNRTVAGVHFPIDSWAGAALGTAIGDIILALCGHGTSFNAPRYAENGLTHPQNIDFSIHRMDDAHLSEQAGLRRGDAVAVADPDPLFQWLWARMAGELYPAPIGSSQGQ